MRWLRIEPFLDVQVVARTADGTVVPVHQPPLDLPVTCAEVSLAAEETAQWGTPLRLAFGTAPRDAHGFTWWIDADPADVVLEAHVQVADEVHVCPLSVGRSEAPHLVRHPPPSRYPPPSPDVLSAELAAILQRPPSLDAWNALTRLLLVWPEDTMGRVPHEALEGHLSAWPDATRCLSGHVVDRLDATLERMGPLARRIEIHTPRSDAGSTWLWKVAREPLLVRVTSLEVTRSEVGAGALDVLLDPPALHRLHTLDLTLQDWTPGMVEALARGRIIPHLRHLGLRSGHLDDDQLVRALGPHDLRGLRSLDLRHNRLTPRGKAWIRSRWGGPWLGLRL